MPAAASGLKNYKMFSSFFKKKPTPEEEVEAWDKAGKPAPPPHAVKQKAIQWYAEQYGIKLLVETGTFLGDMVAAQLPYFSKIFSIELSQKLHRKATKNCPPPLLTHSTLPMARDLNF